MERISNRLRRVREGRGFTDALLATIGCSMPAGFVAAGPDGCLAYVNDAFCRMTGWSREELVGSRPPFPFWPPEEAEGLRDIHRMVTEGRAPPGDFPFRLRRRNEERFEVLAAVAPLPRGEGETAGWLALLHDMTGCRRISAGDEMMSCMSHVAAGIASEVRNALGGLNVYLSALEKIGEESAGLEPENREVMKAVVALMGASSRKIDAAVRRIMDFARPAPLSLAPADVNHAVRDAVSLSMPALKKAGIRVETSLSGELPPAWADTALVVQVLLNLIGNAVQAMEDLDRPRIIEIASRLEGGYVLIEVADSGPGIPPELREKVFEPFFTTRENRSGIGLSFSRRVIRDHGGFIGVGHGRRGGAVFRIGIPVFRDEAA